MQTSTISKDFSKTSVLIGSKAVDVNTIPRNSQTVCPQLVSQLQEYNALVLKEAEEWFRYNPITLANYYDVWGRLSIEVEDIKSALMSGNAFKLNIEFHDLLVKGMCLKILSSRFVKIG